MKDRGLNVYDSSFRFIIKPNLTCWFLSVGHYLFLSHFNLSFFCRWSIFFLLQTATLLTSHVVLRLESSDTVSHSLLILQSIRKGLISD